MADWRTRLINDLSRFERFDTGRTTPTNIPDIALILDDYATKGATSGYLEQPPGDKIRL